MLARRWFLVVLVLGVGLAVARPGWLHPWTEPVPPRLVVGVSLFLTAWGLESRSLLRALTRPAPALWAVAISYGALPPLAWLAGTLLEPDYRVGLVTIASAPCTLASAVLWSRMAGGSEATALLVVLLTTATSWLATTFWLTAATATVVAVDAPRMMGELLVALVLPVLGGQLVRLSPRLAAGATRHKVALGVIAKLLIFVIVLKAAVHLANQLGRWSDVWAPRSLLTAASLCLAVHLAGLLGGLGTSRLLGFERPDQVAVAFAGSQKTLPVALLLHEAYFQEAHPLAVVPLVFYHVGQLIADTFVAEALAPKPCPPKS